MNRNQAAAYIAAQNTLAAMELAGMVSENQHAMMCGNSPPYGEKQFDDLRQKWECVLGPNAVIAFYQQHTDD